MIVALASPRIASTIHDGLERIKRLVSDASRQIAACARQASARRSCPMGEEGVLVQDVKADEATGFLAARYAPERYQE